MIAINWANTSFLLLLGFGMLVLALLYFGIRWIEYLEAKEGKEQKADPIQKTLLAGLLIFILYFLGFWLGVLDKTEFKRNLWIPFALTGCVGVFYWFVLQAKRPYSLDKQLQIAKKHVTRYYEGKEYVGQARIKLLMIYKQTSNIQGKFAGNFLLECMIFDVKQKVWVQVHIYPPEEILHLQPNPPSNLLSKLEAEGAVVQKNYLDEEFGASEDEAKKKED